MRTPEFRRTLSPTSAGRKDVPSYNPSRPYLPVTEDPSARALQNLGKQINAIGERIEDRDSSLKANDLSLQFSEDIAKFQNELDPDNYSQWHKSLDTYTEELKSNYEARADELNLGPEYRARLRARLASDASTAETQTMKAAAQRERVVVPAKLKALIEKIAKDSAAEGFASENTRQRIQIGMDSIERAVDVIGRTAADVLRNELLASVEDGYFSRQIQVDPEGVSAAGINQFEHVTPQRAAALQNRADSEAASRRNIKKAKMADDLAAAATAMNDIQATIVNDDFTSQADMSALGDKYSQMALRIEVLRELYPEGAAEIDSLEMKIEVGAVAAYAMRSVEFGNRNTIKQDIESFRKEITQSANQHPGKADEMEKWMGILQRYSADKVVRLQNGEILKSVIDKNISARNNPEVQAVVDEAYWERVMPDATQKSM
jgi:hypothetical protein